MSKVSFVAGGGIELNDGDEFEGDGRAAEIETALPSLVGPSVDGEVGAFADDGNFSGAGLAHVEPSTVWA